MSKNRVPLWFIRILLICLIAFNLFVIFFFSSQTAEESSQTSSQVSSVIAGTVVKDFDRKPETEQQETVQQIDPFVRRLAHIAEFGSLGGLILLLLMTWRGNSLIRLALSCGSTLVIAVIDEGLQGFSEGRSTQFQDILCDCLGAIIVCALLWAVTRISKHSKKGI